MLSFSDKAEFLHFYSLAFPLTQWWEKALIKPRHFMVLQYIGGFRFMVDRILSNGSSTRLETEIQSLSIVLKKIILIIYFLTNKHGSLQFPILMLRRQHGRGESICYEKRQNEITSQIGLLTGSHTKFKRFWAYRTNHKSSNPNIYTLTYGSDH